MTPNKIDEIATAIVQGRGGDRPSRIVMELAAIRRLLQAQTGEEPPVNHWKPQALHPTLCENCGQVLEAHSFDGKWDRCRRVPFLTTQKRKTLTVCPDCAELEHDPDCPRV